jgi:hypothetical protein
MRDNKFVRWLITLAKNSPWLFIALGLHVILAAGMSVMYIAHEMAKQNDSTTTIAVTAPHEAAQEVVQPPEEIDRKKIPENEVSQELVTYEEETTFIPTEEVVEEDLFQDIGDPTGADDGSEAFTGGTSIGVGAGGHFGTGNPSAFASRRAGTATKTKKGRPPKGATTGTEEAVLEGLRWLLRHQNDDGSWRVSTVAAHCKGGTCMPEKAEVSETYDVGLTGLSLLAFLGQGISVGSKIEIVDTAMGKRYQAGTNVKSAVRWLKDHQRDDGAFTETEHTYMYNQALATMAMCEAFGISKNRELRQPAQKGVDFLCASQKVSQDGARWGWRYESKAEMDAMKASGAVDESAYKSVITDVDISHTCWVVMALKSAVLVGLDVPSEVLEGALGYAQYTTGKDGQVGYRNPYEAGNTLNGPRDEYTYHTGTMSALGMLVRTFVTHDVEDAFLDLGSKQLLKDLPTVSKDKLSIDYYYWYYATLALNQFDGPDSPRKGAGKYWEPWNKALIEAILPLQNQSKAREVCTRGGWLDPDRWGGNTGYAIYSTAINVLTLEVYYRYENAFGLSSEGKAGVMASPKAAPAATPAPDVAGPPK